MYTRQKLHRDLIIVRKLNIINNTIINVSSIDFNEDGIVCLVKLTASQNSVARHAIYKIVPSPTLVQLMKIFELD